MARFKSIATKQNLALLLIALLLSLVVSVGYAFAKAETGPGAPAASNIEVQAAGTTTEPSSGEAATGEAEGGTEAENPHQLNPADEFTEALHPVDIGGHLLQFKIGPLDMSINKVVIYLVIGAVLTAIICIGISKGARMLPSGKQTAFEGLYEYVRDTLVGAVMPAQAAVRWFPYIATLFLFILISNFIGLVPLPFNLANGFHNIPEFKTYAATANINVTVALALITFVATHVSGMRANGPIRYIKNWAPPTAPPVLKQVLLGLHGISEIFRLVSLSVRLFANLAAGHLVLLVFYAMILLIQSWAIAALIAPLELGIVVVSLFEIFVALIQAYIFAILSAVYIGGAIHQEH